jgi:pimeloyl-ACP methyl ester carboxylesterase
MGFSSRPQPDFKDSKDYINFFIDSIEAFRIKIFKDYSEEDNKKFYLIGHSLGGYLSTNYSIKYPKYIIKLFLLSPVGITDMENNTEENEESNSFRKTFRDSIICLIWPLKTTLQNLVNNFLFKNSIKNGLLNRYTIDQKETELFRDLTFHCLANYPKDLDHAIYYILKLPLPMAIWPLENVIPKRIKDFSIDIIYGSDDWMESKGAKRIYENQKNKKESITSKINLYYMRSGRHTFNLERPIDTSRYILNGIKIDEFNKSKISNPNENILYNQDSKLNELLDI